ncbi:transporter substrate-binding domain-containing protein [Lactococcus formosensis]|uniref:transporter substrate-binding domain-containing protein n=1 Tax=Lactococcus formosensis TaxID=1281486 RepID=UPI00254A1B6F|nr:transporter substrate-binding domain-containing protein [Lactococcus formosensis]
MKKIKFYLFPFLLLFIFMSLTACEVNTKKNTWQKIEEDKTITIGYEADFAPLTSMQESGKPDGFNVALAESIFASYNIKIDWKALDWSSKEKALKEGEVDLIWGPYTANKTREKTILFSQPYHTGSLVLLVPKEAELYNIGDMHNQAIGGQKASAAYDLFSDYPQILKNIAKENLMFLYNQPSDAIAALQAGEIQAVLLDKDYTKAYLRSHQLEGLYSMLDTPYPQVEYAVAARKSDTELMNKVNQGLQALQQSGEFSKLSKQWFLH